MNELAVQAANGTNSKSDRQSIQNEIDQLTTEIDRVAETTKFNETYLLKGDVGGADKNIKLQGHDAGLKGSLVASTKTAGLYTFTADALNPKDKVNIGGKEYTIVADGVTKAGEGEISKAVAYTKMVTELTNANSIGSGAPQITHTNNVFKFTLADVSVKKALSFNLHVGADADMTNKIGVDIETMNSKYLGVKGLDVVGQTNDNGITATYAIDAIADAVQKVSDQRSALGAIQNRLEHTIANVDNVVENTTAAESRIRDTDMAEEMVQYSKNNILAQAGQSMLAQANQSTQGVLSLLG
jgi:flagellin